LIAIATVVIKMFVPNQNPDAPNASAANNPLPSANPPAETNGIEILSAIVGIKTNGATFPETCLCFPALCYNEINTCSF
jgi:hypothetical protein